MFETIEGIEKPQFFNVLLIDTEKDAPQIIKTVGGLNEWRKLLKCELIDIQERRIDGAYYDIIADDDALSRGQPKPSGIGTDGETIHFVGNIILCTCDEEGNETGLTDDQIKNLVKHIVYLKAKEPQEGQAARWAAIRDLEY